MTSCTILLKLLFLIGIVGVPAAYCCLQADKSSLLQLKNSLVLESFPPGLSSMLLSWNSTTDCCVWGGVKCSDDGRVIGLDLSGQYISGGIDTSLFNLQHLRHLDLSWNRFNGTQIPSGIGKLVNLIHLDLSNSGFAGQVPVEIARLTSLLTLNLSNPFPFPIAHSLKLENPKLSKLVGKLSRLTELRLDGVNMSAEAEGCEWCHALSASLPNLQVLTLSDCSLSGPLHVSLAKLQRLAVIDLSYNNLSSAVPDFLANLTSLTLKDAGLSGNITQHIFFSMPFLQYLDLSDNILLSGTLPDSVGSIKSLSTLDFENCGLIGTITNIQWKNLENLVHLNLRGNALTGSVPPSLFSLPSLKNLELSSNHFSGELLVPASSSILEVVNLRSNKFEGPIPTSIFNLSSLLQLDLSYNNFTGTTDHTTINHHFIDVRLASCSLREFPGFLRNQSMLRWLDLSDNNIEADIPSWIWKPILYNLNLSHNFLTGFEGPPMNFTALWILDLSSNLLQGQIPLPPSARYLDYSSNNFTSVIPLEFGNYLPNIAILLLSSNNLQGSIPPSLCNISANNADIGDLSNNLLSGAIPPCLTAMNFGVLNLKRNNLSGTIPDSFQSNCSLQTLDLSENRLQGAVPKSIANCKALKVVNLGRNELNGRFPCSLMQISSLHVLVLRSNRFYGSLRCALSNATTSWSRIQVIDIAANSFNGELPHESFKGWTMMAQPDTVEPKLEYLGYGPYYEDKVTITTKGLTIEWEKILTIFNAIDFSCNHFEGSIPRSVVNLKSLHALNLSHNHFTGQIPSSLGNLEELESLDLANNTLTGVIPEQLASLNFLSYLNLSFNQLEGIIPTSTQLQSFSEWSYTGNKGLYGPPLKINCTDTCGHNGSPLDPTSADVGNEIDWQLICAEIGYAVGLGSVIGSLVFWKRWRKWYFEHVDHLLFRIFPRLDPQRRDHVRRICRRKKDARAAMMQ